MKMVIGVRFVRIENKEEESTYIKPVPFPRIPP